MRHLGAEDRLVVEVSRVAGVDTPVRCRARFATSAGVGGEELTSKTPGVWPAGLDAPPHLTTTELIHALKARALLGSTVPPRFVNGLMRAMKTATAVRAVQASGWTYVEVDGFGVGWQAKENRAQRKQGTQLIAISRIRRDPELQVRAATDKMTVFSYAELLKQEDEFPPVTVFDDGEVLWLADGNHTLLAHKLAGKSMVRADVRRGTRRDALDHACRANGRHGLPLSAADDPEPGSAAEWEYDWELYDQLKPDHPESPIDLAIEARSVQRALGIPY
jgi:hypothetical protein